ncbi:MAG TPA: DUF4255 domain-containing protein [Myxococcota bacterium]|nr:DUF4255 domain-containing protein [Myxococcota bacterium]
MANLHAIHSVSRALVNYLRGSFPPGLVTPAPAFEVFSSAQQHTPGSPGNTVSLWLYRITTNEHARGVVPTAGAAGAAAPLALDLHYLLTVWADDASNEQTLLAWAMTQIHRTPQMDISLLSDQIVLPGASHPAGWRLDDVLTVVQEAMSSEDLMRIWGAVSSPYHISVPYVVRVVRIDAETIVEPARVVSTRMRFEGVEADNE